jgi:hypothetical protein
MNKKKLQAVLTSYGRTFLAVVLYAITQGETDLKSILLAGAVATVGPAIRAINPNDRAFGLIADKTTAEITKLLKAEKKKTAK